MEGKEGKFRRRRKHWKKGERRVIKRGKKRNKYLRSGKTTRNRRIKETEEELVEEEAKTGSW